MAIITTTTNLSSVTYTSGEVIILDGGPDKVLTINSQPPLPIGSLSCLNAGKIRIENTSTTTPIIIQFAAPANRFAIKAAASAEIVGEWIVVGIGNNTANQSLFNSGNIGGRNIDFPSYIEVETGNNTGVYTPHFLAVTSMGGNLGHIHFFQRTTFGSGYLGQVLFYDPVTQVVSCGDGVNGNRIPTGARVRIPNIHITGVPVTTTLSAAVTTGATATLTVASAAAFATSGEVQIGSERWSYTGKTATTLTGCTRSLYGTISAAYAVGEMVRQILPHASIAQFDTNPSGQVSIDKCSFGEGFSVRFTNSGNLDIKNIGAIGTISTSGFLGFNKFFRCCSQAFTKLDIASNNSMSITNGIGPGSFNELYALSIGVSTVQNSFFHSSASSIQIENIHGWMDRRPNFLNAVSSRSMFLYGANNITVRNLNIMGSYLVLGQCTKTNIQGVNISDTLNGLNQSAYGIQSVLFAGAIDPSISGTQVIGSPPRFVIFATDALSTNIVLSNKGFPTLDLKNNSSGLISDAAFRTVVSHFSIANQRLNPITISAAKGCVLRRISMVVPGSTSGDGLSYGSESIVDQVGGLRRRYDSNSGAVDYSPFATLNNGATGALTCGMFGGQSTKQIYQVTGSAYLNNAGGILLPAIGDSIVATNIDAPLMAITGFTGSVEYQGTTPTTGINYEFSMRAWGASSWGAWQSLSIANLNTELALIPGYNSDDVGLDFRLRMTATTASTTRIINEIVLPTTVSQTYNPAVWKIDASLYTAIGANYRTSNGVKTVAAGTITSSPTVLQLPSDFDGTVYSVTTEVRQAGFNRSAINSTYSYSPIDIRISLEPSLSFTDTNVSGIAFNKTSKIITISQSVTTSNLFDSLSRWFAELANFDTQSFFSAGGGVLSLTNGWNIALTATGSINPGATLRNIEMDGLFTNAIGSSYLVQITDTNGPKYPPITFTGFPVLANSNGKLPESVFGIKNEVTGVWTTFDASSGSVSVSLSALGLNGHTFTIVADAKGYYRTPEITGVPLNFGGQNFANLFEKMIDSDGNDLYGRGIQAEKDRIVYTAADATFDLDGGPISFSSAIDKKEELTSSQSAITTMNTAIIRSMRFSQNPYAKTVSLPPPLKIRSNATTTTAPILLDFNVVEAGNVNGDPYIHSSRPEVQVRVSKVIVDPSALSNLAIIPALL